MPAEFGEIARLLLELVAENIPAGFEQSMSYGMISFDVPLSMYPQGYNGNPKQALPFINIGVQKHHVSLYHMGLYSSPWLMEWFMTEWTMRNKKRPDMGKSCIRFKKSEEIPIDLIAELATKMSPDDWISKYEEITAQRKK